MIIYNYELIFLSHKDLNHSYEANICLQLSEIFHFCVMYMWLLLDIQMEKDILSSALPILVDIYIDVNVTLHSQILYQFYTYHLSRILKEIIMTDFGSFCLSSLTAQIRLVALLNFQNYLLISMNFCSVESLTCIGRNYRPTFVKIKMRKYKQSNKEISWIHLKECNF